MIYPSWYFWFCGTIFPCSPTTEEYSKVRLEFTIAKINNWYAFITIC